MSNDERVLEAARAIRPYLSQLLGPATETIDSELAELLARASSGQEVDALILATLRKHSATHDWAAAFLKAGIPPDVTPLEERYGELPGRPHASPAPRYACDSCDYVWYRRIVGVPIPKCPTHNTTLKPAPIVG